MRTHRGLRMTGLETLEDRSVPSLFGFHGFGGGGNSLPTEDARAVQQAFQTFEQTYSRDVRTILFAPGMTPSAQLSAFNTAVGTGTGTPAATSALGMLESSINSDIANLSSATTLTTQIDGELTTLQGQLTGLTLPTTTTTTNRAIRSYTNQGLMDIQQTASQVVQQVKSAPAPTGTISQATLQTALSSVNTAFQTFRQGLNSDVKSIEQTPGTTPQTTYQADVLSRIQTLNTSIDTAVGTLGLPSSQATTLETTIQNDLLTGTSTTTSSLQSRLDALTVPSSTRFFSNIVFRLRTAVATGLAQSQVDQAISKAVGQYNASL